MERSNSGAGALGSFDVPTENARVKLPILPPQTIDPGAAEIEVVTHVVGVQEPLKTTAPLSSIMMTLLLLSLIFSTGGVSALSRADDKSRLEAIRRADVNLDNVVFSFRLIFAGEPCFGKYSKSRCSVKGTNAAKQHRQRAVLYIRKRMRANVASNPIATLGTYL